jgi:uncharacterized membrane protein
MSLLTGAFRTLAALCAAGMVVAGFAAGPAYAKPADRAPAGAGYQVKRLVSRSGAMFLPSDGGNPINNRGLVAGSTTVAQVSRAAVFDLRTKRMRVLSAFAGQRTEATDINGRGEVSGTVYPASGGSRAFWWSTKTGRVRMLPLHGGTASVSIALNDRGIVLGSVQDPDWTPTIWDVRAGTDRRLTELDDAQAINNRGWVAGTAHYRADSRASKALVWRPSGTLIELPFLPGDDSSLVTGINDTGQVVGTSMNVEQEDELFGVPVVWTVRGRTICALTRPGDLDTPFAINDRGRIVGGYLTAGSAEDRPYRAVTWSHCGADPVTLPGRPAHAFGVNDRGRIVGRGDLFLSTAYGVLWTRHRT